MELINEFTEQYLDVSLEVLQSGNRTRYISNKRYMLIGLLVDQYKWDKPRIAKLLNRQISGIRSAYPTHLKLLDVDAEYREQYKVLSSTKTDIEVQDNNYKNNFKHIKLEHLRTGEVLYFKSRAEAAKHFKCSQPLINYYLRNNINNFFGYKIIK